MQEKLTKSLRGSLSIAFPLVFGAAALAAGSVMPQIAKAADAASSNADLAAFVCQPGIERLLGTSDAAFVDDGGSTLHGFDAARGTGSGEGPLEVSFVASTTAAAYFYTQTCDICSDLIQCDLSTGTATFYKSSHMLGCADLPAQAQLDPECKG